jgi:hypothetical protein
MKRILTVQLQVNAEQRARLLALQQAFAEVCNALVPVVRQNRCWNRVGLHHLTYHALRSRFPRMGSQMVCNAIYSVSRAYRLVPRNPDAPLPLLLFLPGAPVFFDRHTVSIRDGRLSMYTQDGRIHFGFALPAELLNVFSLGRLREIVLYRTGEMFTLSFCLQDEEVDEAENSTSGELPEYVVLLPETPDVPETPSETSQERAYQPVEA